jgi:hypothetical protein
MLIKYRMNISHMVARVWNCAYSIYWIGEIPSSWKEDVIFPIHKGNNKPRKLTNSYRTSALLPCLLNVFEKLLLGRMKSHISTNTVFPNIQQQGFQQKLGFVGTLPLAWPEISLEEEFVYFIFYMEFCIGRVISHSLKCCWRNCISIC